MAATYDPTLATAKDRVRRLMGDTAAPWKFQDEEIAAELGYVGIVDPQATPDPINEIGVAISLLETYPSGSGNETTIRQGSVSRTYKAGYDASGLLASLRRRLASLVGAQTEGGGIIAIGKFDPCESDQWTTSCGSPIGLL